MIFWLFVCNFKIFCKIIKINEENLLLHVLSEKKGAKVFIFVYPYLCDRKNVAFQFANLKKAKKIFNNGIGVHKFRNFDQILDKTFVETEFSKKLMKLKYEKSLQIFGLNFKSTKMDYNVKINLLDKTNLKACKNFQTINSILILNNQSVTNFLSDESNAIVVSGNLQYLQLLEKEFKNITLIFYEIDKTAENLEQLMQEILSES